MTAFAGIDSGTQSCKALIVDAAGRVLGRGQAPHTMIEGLPPGASEQHPAEWIEAMVASLRAAIAQAGVAPDSIVAIGVSGQQHGFVPLDAGGDVIRPAKLWNDTSTAHQARRLMEALGGPDAYARATGNPLPPGYTASKILWLKECEPANFARLATVLLPHDYLNYWLTGVATMEWGDASGTGLMDVRTREWVPAGINAIGQALAAALPTPRDPAMPAGVLRAAAAERLGLRAGTLVSAGGGDNMMGAIGTGAVTPGRVTVSLGTSGTIYAYSASPVVDPQGEVAAFCDSTGGWLPLVCTMNVTTSTEMVRAMFGLEIGGLESAVSAVSPGADGLMLLPYLQGERTPNLPDATGVWIGASPRTRTAGHHARAAMEGTILGLGYGLRRLRELGIDASDIAIIGGGARSAAWRAIAASAFDARVRPTIEPEGGALGAALQACWCWHRESGEARPIADIADEWVRFDDAATAEPVEAHVALYRDLQRLHDQASVALRPVFAEHRRLRLQS